MASPDTIELEPLLAPISEENPSGEELSRTSESFDRVNSLKEQSKASERKYREFAMFGKEDGAAEPDPPAWSEMVRVASKLLAEESKDLRVAAWLAEGLMRTHGFAGLRDGLRVCQGLCSDQFWPTIHPAPDEEDGHERTVAQLAGLCSEASFAPLNEIVITNYGDEQYTLADYADAVELAKVDASTREKRVQEGAISFEKFQHAVLNSPPTFYVDLVEDLDESIRLVSELSDFLDGEGRCQPNQYDEPTSPSVMALKDRLQEIKHDVSSLARAHLDAVASAAASEEMADQEGGEVGTAVTVAGQQVATKVTRMSDAHLETREEAFRALDKIADFFERTEPHSPLAHAIRQAITWGQMSYQELLKDIVRDHGSLEDIFRRVGVPKTDDN